MLTQKNLRAVFTANFRHYSKPIEVESDEEAARIGTARGAACFTTYESEPKDESFRRYLGVDKIYTRDELVSHLQQEARTAPDLREALEVLACVIGNAPVNSVFHGNDPGDWNHFNPGEKAYDSASRQIWPKPVAGRKP